MGQVAQQLQDGNPLDRSIFTGLIVLALGILFKRGFDWGAFCMSNLALTIFLLFALSSVLWSDYPLITLKRWFRDLGNYAVLLVVLSDPRPVDAVRTLLRRLSYVLISLSTLLVKYFTALGMIYSIYSGAPEYQGATTSKNMLGVACLISGLFFFWDTLSLWSDRRQGRTKLILTVNLAYLAMTLWLLKLSQSSTSMACLGLGCFMIVAAQSKFFRRHPGLLKTIAPAGFCLFVVLALGFGATGDIAGLLGKDATLTDRTKIWGFLFTMHVNPVLGAGYENFWMGPRLLWFWTRAGLGPINEAHNGFLEVYLNLGLVGLTILCAFLIASYKVICKRLKPFSSFGSLTLALWTSLLFYSITEAGFRTNYLWLAFLLGGISVPRRAQQRMQSTYDSERAMERDAAEATRLSVGAGFYRF
jgi:O-antigen ligase